MQEGKTGKAIFKTTTKQEFMSNRNKIMGMVAGLLLLAPVFQAFRQGPAAPGETDPIKGFLFGDDRPFPQCHASTVIALKNGRYLAAWFGGTKEKDDDVGIWITSGAPGRWQPPVEVAKIRQEPHWNPVLFKAPDGTIWLFFKVGKEIPTWQTYVMTSGNEGKTWSAPGELVPGDTGGRGPVRNKMIVLSNGDWLAGASNEMGDWNVFFDRSADKGKTWTATPYIGIDRRQITGKGIIQPTLWESAPGRVHALLRSTAGVICRTDSRDYGKTWSAARKTTLPNPNSGIDVARLPGGTLALAYNPTGENWGSRGALALAVSTDNGQTWSKQLMIEKGAGKDEYSYPAIISTGNRVMVTYTWNRKKIAFWSASKDWILENATPIK
ncbi:sialidase family protein [Niabella drilacis]|uniref:Predicted neuraminidase (Sialidase) n=1 Tax=Niabella drilacis (strain DSM 25811 / CCM 8410 / CCUG 62505 / LMG 26954 / E90) TaxID=1285928 RepID=A0A1G6Y3B8_NIADE|nr:sialidase family protein [Niabella drilacis]SDD84125.1 Predicted neuraminidase (sialidase) [Niabella drilacis]